jgi:hypothetical protein
MPRNCLSDCKLGLGFLLLAFGVAVAAVEGVVASPGTHLRAQTSGRRAGASGSSRLPLKVCIVSADFWGLPGAGEDFHSAGAGRSLGFIGDVPGFGVSVNSLQTKSGRPLFIGSSLPL